MPKTIWLFADGTWQQVGSLTLTGLTGGIDFNDHFSQDHLGNNARYLDLETNEDSELVMRTRSSDGVQVHAGFKFTSAAVGGFQVDLDNESSFLFQANGSSSATAADDYLDATVSHPSLLVPPATPVTMDPDPSAYAAFQFVNNSDANFEILNTGTGVISLHNTDGSILLTTGGGDLIMDVSNIGRIQVITPTLLLNGLPTTDPGVSGAVWISSGDVVLSGFTPGGGSGIQFNTDPQSGTWLIVTTTGQTSRTFLDADSSTSFTYGVVFEMTPNLSGSGRAMRVQASGDGNPQLHALDIALAQTGGIAKGLWITADTTSTPTLTIMGDTAIEASTAGLTIGWRSFIGAAVGNDATGVSATSQTIIGGAGVSVAGSFDSYAFGNGNSTGVFAQSTAQGTGASVAVDANVSGQNSSTAGDQIAFRGHTGTRATGPEAYGLRLRLDQVSGGITHLHPVEINVNGTVMFRIDSDGNIYTKTGASLHATL